VTVIGQLEPTRMAQQLNNSTIIIVAASGLTTTCAQSNAQKILTN
jgi:hypothetical protein